VEGGCCRREIFQRFRTAVSLGRAKKLAVAIRTAAEKIARKEGAAEVKTFILPK